MAAPSQPASRFLFVGNHPALDFVNTLPMRAGRPHELLATPGDLVDWLCEVGLLAPRVADRLRDRGKDERPLARALEAARTLRTAVRDAVLHLQRGRAVPDRILGTLNDHLRADCQWTEIVRVGGGLRLEQRFEPRRAEDLLAPIARAAASLLCDADPTLIKQCDGPHCVLFFYDETKNHARRWCSMRTCGNRAKAAAHYQRHAAKSRRMS